MGQYFPIVKVESAEYTADSYREAMHRIYVLCKSLQCSQQTCH